MSVPTEQRPLRLAYRCRRGVACAPDDVFRQLVELGGARGWYAANRLWQLRGALDRLVGGPGPARRTRANGLAEGDRVDLWRVAALRSPTLLELEARMKLPGRGALRFDVEPSAGKTIVAATVTFETRSGLGRLYWYLLYPLHAYVFRGLLRGLARASVRSARKRRPPSPIAPIRPPVPPRQAEQLAPCMTGCPNGTNIRGWIAIVAQRRKLGLDDAEAYTRAWRTIVDVNPFPAVTGRICPHPCEARCNREGTDGAVSVKQLERFLGDWAIRQRLELPRLERGPRDESVGVVGSGPAGLSFAYQMARRGYPVTVYERQPAAGGMLRYGIPAYRLPRGVLDAEIGRILDLGVELRVDTRVGAGVPLDVLRRRHAVVFLGIGAPVCRSLGIPGELGAGVWSATDYLERAQRGAAPPLGERVAVVGGGDVAFDAARTARRTGAEVTVVYRRSRAEMPAAADEIEEALLEGVRLELLAAPCGIARSSGKPRSLLLRRTRLGAPDASGRRRPELLPGSGFALPVTAVLVAVTRGPDWSGIEIPREACDGRLGENLWSGGDMQEVGIASASIAHGRRAAEAVDARLRGGAPAPTPAPERRPLRAEALHLGDSTPRPRARPRARRPEDWLSEPQAEIHLGLSEPQFLREVDRCLSCGSCHGCERCWMYCAHGCFSRLEEVQPGAYFALSVDQCHKCGKCVDLCPCGFLTDSTPC